MVSIQVLTGGSGCAQTGDDRYTRTSNDWYTDQSTNGANGRTIEQGPTRLFRAFWENDYFNYSGKGTYRAYTAAPGQFHFWPGAGII